jgi:hypothetical protein
MKGSNSYQHMIMTQEGFIVYSNEQLFSTAFLTMGEEEDLILYCENIFPSIYEALKSKQMISFRGVHAPSKSLPGVYDFIFSSKKNQLNPYKPLIECWITDRTKYYQDVQQFRQQQREEAITTKAINN